MAFDIEGARKAGYSDAEIADQLSQRFGFDLAGAKSAGYSDGENRADAAQLAATAVEGGQRIVETRHVGLVDDGLQFSHVLGLGRLESRFEMSGADLGEGRQARDGSLRLRCASDGNQSFT